MDYNNNRYLIISLEDLDKVDSSLYYNYPRMNPTRSIAVVKLVSTETEIGLSHKEALEFVLSDDWKNGNIESITK
jgi:predicted aspartyl protease